MSVSPPIRRMSSTSSSSREDLINQYEAEEERIINVLSRKLEQLREEKIELENVLEAESESHVNRLSREISALRLAQQLSGTSSDRASPTETRASLHTYFGGQLPSEPSAETMLEAMRRENEQLRNRLVSTERDYVRISRLNEVYREELIEHRRRLGLPVDNLIGLSSFDPYAQPTHRRSLSSNASSPSTSILVLPSASHPNSRPVPGVPIPRPPSSIHRPPNSVSEVTTPLSHSPSSSSTSSSPFPFSPPTTSPFPASYVSANTTLTTPPSSTSLVSNPAAFPGPAALARPLSYPSVPPPSLSSSFGSPATSYHPIAAPMAIPGRGRDGPPSPNDSFGNRASPFHRRGSFERRVAESGGLRGVSGSRGGRRESVERGARVAETGTLVPRGRGENNSASAGLSDVQENAQLSVGAAVAVVPEESESGT